ncbi:hypothetical protein [Marmoricola sp. RAF53]|uniref:hypothetical protein n=1 Tax=Marmoricola sp. RAF53 TaxID=3233059 RepID=UPI003F9B5998
MGSVVTRLRTWVGSLVGWRRIAVLGGGGLALILLFDYLVALVLVGGAPEQSERVALAKLDTVPMGQVMLAKAADPKKVEHPHGMAWRKAGVAVLAHSEVDQVQTSAGLRRASDGSALLAFELGDWPCEEKPCDDWDTLKARVNIDGASVPLPAGGDTFVAALPPGTQDVDLVVKADGYTQYLSLSGGYDGPSNIALLTRKERDPKTPIGARFPVVERTSVALEGPQGLQDTYTRDVTVDYWQRRFFLNGKKPGDQTRMFLVVNAFYSYAGRTERYLFGDDEIAFVARDGTRYPPLDVDPSPDQGLLGFEIPASVRGGNLEIGGTVGRTSTTGVPYTATIEQRSLPISLG